MKNKKLKYHYICKDKNGGFFMTAEKCESAKEAQMYIEDNEVLYPFFDELYEKNIIENHSKINNSKMVSTLGGGFVKPRIVKQSISDISTHKELDNAGLIKFLGRVAILEGSLGYGTGDVQEDLIELINPCLLLDNIYREHEKLIELSSQNIETIILESTFSYQDKIQDAYIEILKIMKSTGWKPKRVINTMNYGLDKFYVMCEPLGIEVYLIEDSFCRLDNDTDFKLTKYECQGHDYDMLKTKYAYLLDD